MTDTNWQEHEAAHEMIRKYGASASVKAGVPHLVNSLVGRGRAVTVEAIEREARSLSLLGRWRELALRQAAR